MLGHGLDGPAVTPRRRVDEPPRCPQEVVEAVFVVYPVEVQKGLLRIDNQSPAKV
jgi:hypothetical protein